MEDLLRFGLWFVAALIVLLILSQTWRNVRRHKLTEVIDKDFAEGGASADEILGIAEREEPTMADASTLSFSATATTRQETEVKPTPQPERAADEMGKDLLVLSVLAKPNQSFVSYDLLQAISACGMQFGEMNIFHYYEETPGGKRKLFSLASATNPGYFDLDRIGDISCVGLTLFTQLQDVPNTQRAFDLMLQTAQQLADDLDGELRANPRTPWNETVMSQYQQKVARYQLTKSL